MTPEEKIVRVLTQIPQGVRYSTADWARVLNEEKRPVREALRALEDSGRVSVERDAGRPDKPLYRLG